ncbi:MAG: hypothetical protein JNM65_02445 [Verrucomicrobiaceae bacterium]|nr:hypothetical protein [Verrucomicrobiaceae bacterium]
MSADVDGALAIAGIADRTQPINAAQASALLAELKESAPVSASSKIVSVAAKPSGVLTESFILQQAQDFMDFLPPSVVNSLPPLHIQVCDWLNAYGEYNKGLVKLGGVSLKTKVKARETIFHELAHWVHLELPGMHPWVQAIKAHFEARTAGEAVVTLGNYAVTGLRDQWWEVYMGRVYNLPEEATHLGVEFPTRNFELLAAPNRFAAVWSKSPEAREDIYLALKGLYP